MHSIRQIQLGSPSSAIRAVRLLTLVAKVMQLPKKVLTAIVRSVMFEPCLYEYSSAYSQSGILLYACGGDSLVSGWRNRLVR